MHGSIIHQSIYTYLECYDYFILSYILYSDIVTHEDSDIIIFIVIKWRGYDKYKEKIRWEEPNMGSL